MNLYIQRLNVEVAGDTGGSPEELRARIEELEEQIEAFRLLEQGLREERLKVEAELRRLRDG